jgi:small-conductance mechanosensitive channel
VRRFRFVFWVSMWVAMGVAAAAPDTAQAPPAELTFPSDQVVAHVSRSIAWYRSVIALQQLPVESDDVVPRDRLNQTALTALQLAFEFGHAAAALADKAAPTKASTAGNASSGAGKSGATDNAATERAGSGAGKSGATDNAAAERAGNGAGKPGATDNTGAAGNTSAGGTPDTSGKPDAAGKAGDSSQGQKDDASQGEAGDIDRAAARLADRISTLQAQLKSLDEQIAQADPKNRQTLIAQRGEVSAALDLTNEIQATVGQIQKFEETSDARANGASGGLAAQIADLQKTVPEVGQIGGRLHGGGGSASASSGGTSSGGSGGVSSGASGGGSSGGGGSGNSSGGSGGGSSGGSSGAAPAAAPAAAAANANAEAFRPESAGVIALIGKWFSLEGARRQLADVTKQTDALTKELDGIRGAVTQDARNLARQNIDASSTDAAQIAQAKLQFEASSVRFKQLSTLLIPVGEQEFSVESARNILSTWHDSIAARNATVARYLVLRLGFLLGSVAVVLIISEVWRRATFRYLKDSRRRQQFLALRRVAVGIALTVVIGFGLVTEVGSLATYAGLITAGLAVALQNVILAVVAYFFLIGRYGVRVGDRVTLAGVTGRVVEIGLVRIYLMELTGPELRSTGRMVVLSNAVLFQPTALFKQMPGGDFFWHTIMLTVAPTTDVSAAEKRLSEAADSVYENYRPAIEEQHAALQRFIDFETAMPKPEVYVRLTDKGLECTVRYPVEPARAASIDQKMLTALREAQSKQPPLELVGGPLLMTSDT